jgi:DNA polymerase I-like protein with 3'-5' exonuclease and polymerase domains
MNFKMRLHPQTQQAYQLFHDGILALAHAEQQGICIDVEYIKNKINHLERKIIRAENQFKETEFFKHWQQSSKSTVNIYSGTQLNNYLYNVKGIKPLKVTKTSTEDNVKGSTDGEALKKLKIPELAFYEDRTKIKKSLDVLNGFLREQVNGVLHPFYNLHIARTYRSSSQNPNFQNIPKRDEEMMQICRRALLPRPGHLFLEPDFSGIEVRIAACYHKDPTMLKYINDPKSDMHRDMAQQIFKMKSFDKKIPSHYTLRQAAKNGFVFPQFYGDYYRNCADNLACEWGKLPQSKWRPGQGIDMIGWEPAFNTFHLSDHLIKQGIKSFDQFTEHVKAIEQDFWGVRFKVYAEWKKRHYDIYLKNGYIDLLTGFRCHGIMNEKEVSNYPVQGAAFHCLLWSMIQLDKQLRKYNMDSVICGQIHDSMLIDTAPKELKNVWEITQQITTIDLPKTYPWICVPLEIDGDVTEIDQSWATKKAYKS